MKATEIPKIERNLERAKRIVLQISILKTALEHIAEAKEMQISMRCGHDLFEVPICLDEGGAEQIQEFLTHQLAMHERALALIEI